jgi:thiol-disulfide isomerase/thioredoxin/Flp pilus assembly protein TadD
MPDAASTTIRSAALLRHEHFNPKRQEIFLELPTPSMNHEGETTSGPFGSQAIRHLITKSLLAAIVCTSTLHAEGDAYKFNPKFTAAMAEAQTLTRQGQYSFAIEAYKKACKIASNQDAQCLKLLFGLEIKTGAYKDAAATAFNEIAIASDPLHKSAAETHQGQALYFQALEKNKADLYHAADVSLKAAIADDPKNGTAHYLEGYVLARLNQNAAASEQFKQCLTCISPNDPSYLRAQHFAANPELATHKMAPAFTVVALDGTKFNLDAMGGRVVLIDFWATWCGPCNEELPHIKKIAKEFAGQPLVIISVSWDADAARWKDFIAKNDMSWVQYRDSDHRLSNLFGIDAIPHYFTIDSDGVLTSEMLGSGSDVEGKLKKLVAKAIAAHPATPPTTIGN